MNSDRAVMFYDELLSHSDSRKEINEAEIGVKRLKDIFGIPKEGKNSYVRSDGHFDRPAFEARVIDPICEALSKTERVQLILQPNGKFYEKVKRGNRVVAYRFYWILTNRPKIATAKEVKEIQERVDQDPQILKVAKDIVKGEKKPKKSKKTNAKTEKYNDFIQGSLIDDIDIIDKIAHNQKS